MYIQYTDPVHWPVIMHGANILARKGWHILFLGVYNISDPEKRIEMDLTKNIKIKMLSFIRIGLLKKLQFFFYNFWVLLNVVFWKPDVIYASEKLVCPISLLIRKYFSVKLIYHELLCVNNEEDIRPKFLIKARREIAKVCDLCILPNEPRMEKFINEIGDHGRVIYTHAYPPKEEVINLPQKRKSNSKKLKLFYHGMIGPDRLPIELFQALEELKDKAELTIAGVDLADYGHEIKKQIKERDLEKNVNYIGFIQKRDDLLRECSYADVGLSLAQKTVKKDEEPEFDMAGGAQRPFEYMALGLVPLVTDLDDWNRLFVETGFGYSCDPDDKDDIRKVLQRLYIDRDSLFDIGQNNRKQIMDTWNYDNEFRKVENYIE